MRFFRQIFRFFGIFFCFEVLGVAHLYSIIPWHLSNISRVCGFCGTLWKKNYDRLKNGHFFDFLLVSKKPQLVTPHSNRNDLTIPMMQKKTSLMAEISSFSSKIGQNGQIWQKQSKYRLDIPQSARNKLMVTKLIVKKSL